MLETTINSAFRSDRDWARPHDVFIFGSGLVGVAAAIAAARDGHEVTLADASCDLLWEVSRAYGCASAPAGPEWQPLLRDLEAALPPSAGLGFAAWAEIAAARVLARLGVTFLFLTRPLAMQRAGQGFAHVLLATKSGPRTLTASRFIDASEDGALARVAHVGSVVHRKPVSWRSAVHVQAESWAEDSCLERGGVPSERVLRLTSDTAHCQASILLALSRLSDLAKAHLVTTTSFRPLPTYEGHADEGLEPISLDNLIVAAPACLAGGFGPLHLRLHAGRQAAAMLREVRPAPVEAPREPMVPVISRRLTADVAVIGGGTGGAVAALASARGGAATVCADINPFLGGVGTGSGIHAYWYGVSGGFQEEIDDLVQSIAPLFGAANQSKGYHPEAKRLALEQLFARAGVRFERNAMLFSAERSGDRVSACLLATGEGTLRIEAPVWIDGTGDGDLCAVAGAAFAPGRASDGVTSPYTQSAVKTVRAVNKWYLAELNFDSGWVNAADVGDMTRARLIGLEQLSELAGTFDGERIVAVAPMVGVRQARQIDTDYVLSLDDLIQRREFADAATQVGAHFDNHMLDYELESRDAIFWVWCAHQWRTPVASQLPLRSLRPKGLSNVLLACRALGVSRDAHHAIRMMRDMQRLGEAAGSVAAASIGLSGFEAALNASRPKLLESGALSPAGSAPRKHTRYGPDAATHFTDVPDLDPRSGLSCLKAGERSERLWSLFRDQTRHESAVREVLTSNNPSASWLAACMLGLWGNPAAEMRLLSALESREPGDTASTAKYCTDPAFKPFPPDWVVAISVLEQCGTSHSVDALEGVLVDLDAGLDIRVAAARALAGMARRGVPIDVERVEAAAEGVLSVPVAGMFVRPQQFVMSAGDDATDTLPMQRHDMRWKLVLAFAELLDAAGVDDPRFATVLRADARSIVRNAFKPTRRDAR